MSHAGPLCLILALSLPACAHNRSSGGLNLQSVDASEQNSEQSSEESSRESTEDSTDETSSRDEDAMNSNNGPILTTAGVLVTGAAVGLLLWMGNDDPDPQYRQAAARTTRRWLVANRHQLALDLGMGAGPAIDDLAGAAGISTAHQAIFGRLLRTHRKELLALSSPGRLTDERALAFLVRIGDIARADPDLAEDYRRFVESWQRDNRRPPS